MDHQKLEQQQARVLTSASTSNQLVLADPKTPVLSAACGQQTAIVQTQSNSCETDETPMHTRLENALSLIVSHRIGGNSGLGKKKIVLSPPLDKLQRFGIHMTNKALNKIVRDRIFRQRKFPSFFKVRKVDADGNSVTVITSVRVFIPAIILRIDLANFDHLFE